MTESAFKCKGCGREFTSKEALSVHILTDEGLGLKVETEMERAGIRSQAELAQRSGVSPVTISRILGGKTKNPRLGDMADIAHALGRTIDWFYLNDRESKRRLDPILVEFFTYTWPTLSSELRDTFNRIVRLFLEACEYRELQAKFRETEQ